MGLIVFPMLFFMIGFLFKVFRPYYTPLEFVFFNIITSMVILVVLNGATLFITMSYFIQMALLHIGVYLAFAFGGLLTRKLYEWMREKFLTGGITQMITMIALISVMMTLCFSIQYVLTLIY